MIKFHLWVCLKFLSLLLLQLFVVLLFVVLLLLLFFSVVDLFDLVSFRMKMKGMRGNLKILQWCLYFVDNLWFQTACQLGCNNPHGKHLHPHDLEGEKIWKRCIIWSSYLTTKWEREQGIFFVGRNAPRLVPYTYKVVPCRSFMCTPYWDNSNAGRRKLFKGSRSMVRAV